MKRAAFVSGSGQRSRLRSIVLMGMLTAVAAAGSALVVIPLPFARCAPVQHMVNVFCAVLLGPRAGVMVAFAASTIRNLMGIGTFAAYPGSMCGAFLSGLCYRRFHSLKAALLGEIFGTGVLGAVLSYPVAAYLLGNADATLFMFVGPFLISTGAGASAAGLLLTALKKGAFFDRIR